MKKLRIDFGEFQPTPGLDLPASTQHRIWLAGKLRAAGFVFRFGPDGELAGNPPITRWDLPGNGLSVLFEQPDPIDFRALLVRYMAHVGDREGTSCIPDANDSHPGRVQFTESEVAELERIEAEGIEEHGTSSSPRPRLVTWREKPAGPRTPPRPDEVWTNVDPLAGLRR